MSITVYSPVISSVVEISRLCCFLDRAEAVSALGYPLILGRLVRRQTFF